MLIANRIIGSCTLVFAGWFGHSGNADAAPWAEPNDRALRHAVELLRDTQLLPGPIATWPIPWPVLSEALHSISTKELSSQQLQAIAYLKDAVKQADKTKLSSTLKGASKLKSLGGFADSQHDQASARIGLEAMGDIFAANLSVTYIDDPADEAAWRADQSYIAARLGNWGVGVGAIDRYWGPSWQSSLILSTNARPSPGLFIQRLSPDAFESPLLSWLGPWQLTTFINQLERERDQSQAKLWGLRIGHSPLPYLELGYSRTAMFGGGDRPESLGVFKDLLLGKDNRGGSGIADDASNEPGNQLAGFDWRASLHWRSFSGAWYGQIIGEDESGGTPSRNLGSMGVELAGEWAGISQRVWIEGSNTLMRFASEGMPNGAYEHGIYTNGYRHHGRSMGASSDNDSQVYTIGGLLALESGDLINWRISKAYLNTDGSNAPAPAGNPLTDDAISLALVEASYRHDLTEALQIMIGAQYLEKPIDTRWGPQDSNLYLTIKNYW